MTEHACRRGVNFAVWAPNAAGVSLIGDFNSWDPRYHPLRPVGESGVWELFVPGLEAGAVYKYRIAPRGGGPAADKADPYAFAAEVRPRTASIVWDLAGYRWGDAAWSGRPRRAPGARGAAGGVRSSPGILAAPGSAPARRSGAGSTTGSWPTSWCRTSGTWATPTSSRCPSPSIRSTARGAIRSPASSPPPRATARPTTSATSSTGPTSTAWASSRLGSRAFSKDAHGLARFDGTALYEHPDPRRSENLEWGTLAFNHERPEVRAFLLSNAIFWLEEFHLDGLRVDAVSSMIYLDYSRQHWVPNALGGRENLAAARFLQQLNAHVHRHHPGVLMIAEESTAWPRVTGREVRRTASAST